MKTLGLTGDIASGKSTVGRMLQSRGAAHLDADELVRQLYAQADFSQHIADEFGEGILNAQGTIDGAKLRAQVWGQSEQAALLKRLESLVFPAVANLRAQKLDELRLRGGAVAVVEAVKLLESGQGAGCAEIWCVVAPLEVQMRRLMEHRGLDEKAARARLDAQPSPHEKRKLAGDVPLVWIENSGSLQDLEARVTLEWQRFGA